MDARETGERWNNSNSGLKKLAAVLAILAMVAFFALPGLLETKQTLKVIVKSEETGAPVEGASVLLVEGGSVVGLKRTRLTGVAEFQALPAPRLSARVEARGFQPKTLAGLAQKNEVMLAPDVAPNYAAGRKEPSLQALAFDLAAGEEDAGIEPEALEGLQQTFSKQQGYAPAFELPEINAPDCAQLSQPSPTPSPSASPTAEPSPSAQPPPAEPRLENEFSLKYGESTQVGEERIEFYDYAPGGKVRLKVFTQSVDYSTVLSPGAAQLELAAGTLELASSQGDPPTAAFKLYSKTRGVGTTAPKTGSNAPPSQKVELPVVSIGSPNQYDVISTNTPLAGSAFSSKGIYSIEVSLDGGATWAKARGGGKWASEVDYSKPGPLSVKARATDCAGNVGESAELRLHGAACRALVYHGEHERKYDLVLIPSKYGGDAEKFSLHAENALETVFSTPPFNKPELFSKFNVFFYNGDAPCKIAGERPPENRAWKCEVPREYYESCTFADQAVVFVNSNLRAGKSGNPIVASAGEREILLHELGHSVFGLADEYCCDGGYWENDPQPNIYETREKCEQATGAKCFTLGTEGWAHIDVRRGIMEALENKFFDESDLPAFQEFLRKYE